MGPIIAVIFTIITGWLLLKKYNPHAVLLVSGLSMLTISMFLVFKFVVSVVTFGNEAKNHNTIETAIIIFPALNTNCLPRV